MCLLELRAFKPVFVPPNVLLGSPVPVRTILGGGKHSSHPATSSSKTRVCPNVGFLKCKPDGMTPLITSLGGSPSL